MRLIFMGTPEFAVPALDALAAAGHDIAAVYTRAPRPAHRGKALTPSPVQARAEALGLTVRCPRTLRDADEQTAFAALDADIAVVAAYGLILPLPVLEAPRLGCVNIHASLLPRWRGAAPIHRAILAGDIETGVTIMRMAEGLDTGAMLATATTTVDRKTGGDLTTELAALGARLLVETLARPLLPGTPQPDAGITYAAKISKDEARLDPLRPAADLERAVRAFNPAPGAWLTVAGERLKILAAEIVPGDFAAGQTIDNRLTIGTIAGALRPTLVQRPGKPAMPVRDLLNGWRVPTGTPVA